MITPDRIIMLVIVGILTWSFATLIGISNLPYPFFFFLGSCLLLGLETDRLILRQRKTILPFAEVLELIDRDERWLSALYEFDRDPQ